MSGAAAERCLAIIRGAAGGRMRQQRCHGQPSAKRMRSKEPLERRQGPVWEPLRPERVGQVKYDTGRRPFRHRDDVRALRVDKSAATDATTVETVAPYALKHISA